MDCFEELEGIRDRAEAIHAYHIERKHDLLPGWQRTFRENRQRWLDAEKQLQQLRRYHYA